MADLKGRVLSVTSEAVPLVKTGGLADVCGALPGALATQGWEMRTLLPAYPGLAEKLRAPKEIWAESDLFGGPGRVLAGQAAGGMAVMLLDAPHLFDRAGGPYADARGDYGDNPERFAALCWAAAAIAAGGARDGWRPDLLHAHDWQAGLAPAYLRQQGIPVPSVMTIHNIAFQGHAGADRIGSLRLPREGFHRDGFEYWGNISTLKAGLVSADAVTTVSPRYAEELMRPEFGLGLEGVIQSRAGDLHGILNGIDDQVWNPETDPELAPYSARALGRKQENRARLMQEFGVSGAGPLVILVSRLTAQKGIDLVPEAIAPLLAAEGTLCILGSGEPWAEEMVRDLAARHPGRVGLRLGYDEGLSHRMFGGGDAVLVPSRFEPCGLTQLYGLRYGCLPVVAATGGLADTVIGATPASLGADAATGIVFHPVDALALRQALRRLTELFARPKLWAAMQRRAMKADLGWGASAARYGALYESLLAR